MAVTGDIVTAGSSTVFPLTEAVAEQFIDEGYAGSITIDSIGTGAGFERFCVAGETDVSNASRPIRDSERESCLAIGREPLEFRVGTDALAIVVNPENDWLDAGVTLEQLALIFSDQATNWSDVDASWPAEPIQRFTPGTDSGTFDYFIEAVMDPKFVLSDADEGKGEEAFLKAANLQQSEDDNVLVQGVEGNKNAIGYFGYAYYDENQGVLKAVNVDGVTPEAATVLDGTYPLARPLFIYSAANILAEKPQVGQFISYYLTNVSDLVRAVGYFPEPEEELNAAKAQLADILGQ
jgi:phosphate binding protein